MVDDAVRERLHFDDYRKAYAERGEAKKRDAEYLSSAHPDLDEYVRLVRATSEAFARCTWYKQEVARYLSQCVDEGENSEVEATFVGPDGKRIASLTYSARLAHRAFKSAHKELYESFLTEVGASCFKFHDGKTPKDPDDEAQE